MAHDPNSLQQRIASLEKVVSTLRRADDEWAAAYAKARADLQQARIERDGARKMLADRDAEIARLKALLDETRMLPPTTGDPRVDALCRLTARLMRVSFDTAHPLFDADHKRDLETIAWRR